jgi:RimJ/RimL family protein N-acetyltransferase
MKICKYGIILNGLRKEDLEFVREKRNAKEALSSEETHIEITPEMQLEWFESVDNFENFYYIIEYKGVRIGMLNNKKVDWTARTSESSLFLWDDSFTGTIVPSLAALCLIEIGFYYLNWNVCYIRVHSDNPKAVKNAESLGYELTEGKESVENHLYYLTRELFETNAQTILMEAKAFVESEYNDGYLLLEPSDYESGIAQKIETFFTENGINLHRKGKAGSRMYFR